MTVCSLVYFMFELTEGVKSRMKWGDLSLVFIYNMCHVTGKPVFGVSEQVRLKSACSATEIS